jgi:RsiW-degrading membrane proteinase PrsW (M82 family)
VGLVIAGVYIGLHPELTAVFTQITDQVTNAPSVDAAMNAIEPWLNTPVAFLLALFFFSGLAPAIEETAKSLAAWTIFDRLISPAQGFVVGALSGAGFGLFESLMASAMPDSSWATTLMVRGGSTMMHIMASSLTGWGIASFRIGTPGVGRVMRLVAMYALAMFMHGLWNAAAMMIVFGSLRLPAGAGAPDLIGKVLNYSGDSVLIILCITIPAALWFINRRFRMTIPLHLPENLPDLPAPDENEEKVKGVQ